MLSSEFALWRVKRQGGKSEDRLGFVAIKRLLTSGS